MDPFFTLLSLVGSFNIGFGLISLFIKERCYISETLIATLIGLLVGPVALNLISYKQEFSDNFLFQFSRMVISIQVVAVGAVVSKEYFNRALQSIMMLLGPMMIVSWLTATLIVHYVTNLSFTLSLLIGACVTPTDPVLASSILKGKFANRYIPVHLRKLLTFESGANDGLGFPLLTLPIIFLKGNSNSAYSVWFVRTWLYEIGLAVLIGMLIGFLARYLLEKSKKHNLIDKESSIAYILALSFFVIGVTALLKIDDLFACFVCGLIFSWYHTEMGEEIKESHLMEILDLISSQSFFIVFGNLISKDAFTLKNFAVALLIIIFRRLPFVWLLKGFIPQLFNNREMFFTGWYGPIGVGAVFLAEHAKHELHSFHVPFLEEGVNLIHLIVFCSVIIHGITAPVVHFHLRKKVVKSPEELYELSEYTETEGLVSGNMKGEDYDF